MSKLLPIVLIAISISLILTLSEDFLKQSNKGLRLLVDKKNDTKESEAINTKIFFIKNYYAYSLKNLQSPM